MKRITIYTFLSFILISIAFAQETKTYNLRNGDSISGTLVSETDSTVVLMTAFGKLTVSKDKILRQRIVISLKSGDIISGSVISETDDIIILETSLGILEVDTKNIEDMEFVTDNSARTVKRRMAGPVNEKWYFSEERLMDIWFDPTGFGLKSGDFYLSALSWAYGLSDRIQFSTQWYSYFVSDFNIRPKINLFQTGNINRQISASVGGHFHTAGLPRKWVKEERHEIQFHGVGEQDTIKRTQWVRVGTYEEIVGDYYEEEQKSESWGEVFAAVSVSNKRKNNQGRVNYTFGATVTFYPDFDPMTRVYAAIDMDANKNIKILGEIFYDPYFVPLNERSVFDEKDAVDVGPLHFDIGFMTNLVGVPLLGKSENLWFGIHFLDPFISIYYKF